MSNTLECGCITDGEFVAKPCKKHRLGSFAAPDGYAPGKGFARTPHVLQYDGPQMEDYKDWDSWYFARQKWVFERMNAQSKGA